MVELSSLMTKSMGWKHLEELPHLREDMDKQKKDKVLSLEVVPHSHYNVKMEEGKRMRERQRGDKGCLMKWVVVHNSRVDN